MIRILTGMLVMLVVVCMTLGWLLWHERGELGRQDCEVSAAARANKDTQITADAQHQADQGRIGQLESQIAQLQTDADAAAHLRQALESKLAKQTRVLNDVRKTNAEARQCLDTGVPASLLDSLRTAAGGTAGQAGQGSGI